MATKTTKKTVAVKKPSVKKTATKKVVKEEKTTAPAVVEKKQPVKAVAKKTVAKKQPVKVVETKTVAQTADNVPAVNAETNEIKEFGATKLSHSLFVVMTVILWAILTAWIVIEVNYDVTIEHKDAVARRIERRMVNMQKQKEKKLSRRIIRRHAKIDKKADNVRAAKKVTPSKKDVKATPKKAAKSVAKKTNYPPLKLVERKAAFIESEYAPYAGTGKAIIEGNACFELKDGTKQCFENIDVFINPVTTYSDEWYNRGWAGKEFLEKADARALPFNKMVKTGKDGAFRFEGLQPGSYYVGAMICLPQASDVRRCSCTRFASKVTMKNRVNTTLKQVYPEKPAK